MGVEEALRAVLQVQEAGVPELQEVIGIQWRGIKGLGVSQFYKILITGGVGMEFKKYLLRERFSLRQVVGMLTLVILGISVLAYATVTIPNTFTSGTTAKSSEVNANFTALADAMNNRTSATLANMAGTWSYTQFGSFLNGSPSAAPLCTVSHWGTLTLNANGTFSDVQTTVNNNCVGSGGSSIYLNTGGTFTGTWTVSANGSGTLTYGGLTIFFQASRDLNTIVASDNGSISLTYVRQ